VNLPNNRHIVSVKDTHMFESFRHIAKVFDLIIIAISGGSISQQTPGKEMKGMMQDFYNLEIPHVKQDRKNLKEDGESVINDYNKAVEARKTELQVHHG
jgi:hypothetical protein